jgi:glucose/arabinose dehydrogenase
MRLLMIAAAALGLAGSARGEALHLELVTDQIGKPVYVTSPPGDPDRVMIVDQWDNTGAGNIWLIKDGVLQPEPFLELRPVDTGYSTGLLCAAFAPDYETSGHFYVFYNDPTGDVRISRFSVSADPDVADRGSEELIVMIPQPTAIHPGGWLGFGPDGYLYFSCGDGGPGGDLYRRGQDPTTILGKMIRIDVGADDFPLDPQRNYAIPPTNPFLGGPALDEIWALGVRNPWRCSFDRLTGDLYIADVGQLSWEEINFEPAGFAGGANYGWRCREGTHPYESDPECEGVVFDEPFHEYGHTQGLCSITGGFVYRGTAIPALEGKYVFADYCTRRMWSLRYDGSNLTDLVEHPVVVDDPPCLELEWVTSFGEDASGELYVCAHPGQVFKITDLAPGDPDGCEDLCPCDCALPQDGIVKFADLVALLGQWGGPGACDCAAPANGVVNVTDLLCMVADWGPCP